MQEEPRALPHQLDRPDIGLQRLGLCWRLPDQAQQACRRLLAHYRPHSAIRLRQSMAPFMLLLAQLKGAAELSGQGSHQQIHDVTGEKRRHLLASHCVTECIF